MINVAVHPHLAEHISTNNFPLRIVSRPSTIPEFLQVSFLRHASFELLQRLEYQKRRASGQLFYLILVSSLESSHVEDTTSFSFIPFIDSHYCLR